MAQESKTEVVILPPPIIEPELPRGTHRSSSSSLLLLAAVLLPSLAEVEYYRRKR